jgi:hypothetical protein
MCDAFVEHSRTEFLHATYVVAVDNSFHFKCSEFGPVPFDLQDPSAELQLEIASGFWFDHIFGPTVLNRRLHSEPPPRNRSMSVMAIFQQLLKEMSRYPSTGGDIARRTTQP